VSRSPRSLPKLRSLALAALPAALLGVLGAATVSFAQIGTLPAPAVLIEEEEDYLENPEFIWGVVGHTLVSSMKMESVNDAIQIMNGEISQQGTSGIEYQKATGAPAFGLGLRAIIKHRLILFADYERTVYTDEVGGLTSQAKFELPVQAWTGSVAWNFLNGPYNRFGFGFGLSHWSSLAEQRFLENEDEIGKITIDGSTLGQNYFSYLELPLTERLYVHGQIGWRVAKIEDLEFDGLEELREGADQTGFVFVPVAERFEIEPATEEAEAVYDVQLRGGGDSLDYSGFYGRIGFTVYWNPPDRF
jgi:hypothetical protein